MFTLISTMNSKKRSAHYGMLIGLLLVIYASAFGQEIDWYSTDQGGGISTQGEISLTGVIGQVDTIRMEGGSITVAGGYLPLPADLIFENQFD